MALVLAAALALALGEAVPMVRAVGAQIAGAEFASDLLRRAALKQLQVLDQREVERRLDQEWQWHRQTLAKAYDEVGSRNPKWDDPAARALELTAQIYGADPARPGDATDRLPALLDAAVAAGCDDPLVGYLHAKYPSEYGREAAAASADLRAAATRLERSRYSAFRRALALAVAVTAPSELPKSKQPPITPQEVTQGNDLLDRATALLPEVLRDKAIPDRELKVLVVELAKGRQRLGADRLQAYEAIVPVLTKSLPPDAAVLPLIKAVVLTDYAWDVRGHEYADKVDAENMTLFMQRLDDANAALAEAIRKRTTDQSIGTAMMRIVLVVPGDSEMAEWFEVARRLAPGSYEPYDNRRNSLLRRWGGGDEALLAFGREAFARQAWGSRASLELVEVHQWIAKGPPVKPGYMARADVCADIKSVYDAFLARYPDATTDRSRYARRLITCKAWSDADAQFRRLGDRPSMAAFGTREKYDTERTLVSNRLAASR